MERGGRPRKSLQEKKHRLGEELADVLYWVLRLCEEDGCRAGKVSCRKKPRGVSTKYDELQGRIYPAIETKPCDTLGCIALILSPLPRLDTLHKSPATAPLPSVQIGNRSPIFAARRYRACVNGLNPYASAKITIPLPAITAPLIQPFIQSRRYRLSPRTMTPGPKNLRRPSQPPHPRHAQRFQTQRNLHSPR